MTENILISIVAAIPPTIAAVAALIVGLKTSTKADKIHVLVNDRYQKLLDELVEAKKLIATLEEELNHANEFHYKIK